LTFRRSITLGAMRLSTALLDQIVGHAREEAPNECCGLVGGRDGAATTVYRARNEFASPTRYNVHPQDLIRIVNEIEAADEELAAIYHSHTQSAAYPSQTDVNLATNWPDPVYLICSLAGNEPEVRGFEIREREIQEVELVVD
jgi:[CysO sulfur-carrier protein]-S-L-cysteine hydrolase